MARDSALDVARQALAVIEGRSAPLHDARIAASETAVLRLRVGLVEMRAQHRGGPQIARVVDEGDLVVTDKTMRFFGATKEKVWRWNAVTDFDTTGRTVMVPVSSRAAVAGVRLAEPDLAAGLALMGWFTDRASGYDGAGIESRLREHIAKLESRAHQPARGATAAPRSTSPAPAPTRSSLLRTRYLAAAGAVALVIVVAVVGAVASQDHGRTPAPVAAQTAHVADPPAPTTQPPAVEPSPTTSPTPKPTSLAGTYVGELTVTLDQSNSDDGGQTLSREGKKYAMTVVVPASCQGGPSCTVRMSDPYIDRADAEPGAKQDLARVKGKAATFKAGEKRTDDCVDADGSTDGTTKSSETWKLTFKDAKAGRWTKATLAYTWDTTDDYENDCTALYHASGTLVRK